MNIAFFTVCEGCQDGPNELQGNGFDNWICAADDGNAGGTAWLQTQAPVEGGTTFQIRFGICARIPRFRSCCRSAFAS